ncbi:MAG: caspase family protein, partial [Anaerolineales bacterium]|nr:caspase family protein [Anaerolineales bacterium]
MPFEGGHALLIGVGSHTYAPYLDVPISVDDAQAVANVLTSETYCGYPAHQVDVLHNGSATREGILNGLNELATSVKPEDTVTIFYCGHGDYGTDGEYYLVSHDTRIEGSRVKAGTGVSQAALVDSLQKIPAERVLVIFNACHSGEISPTLSVDQALGSKILPDTAKDALLSSGSGRIIITACKEEQLSYIG